ncbi:H-NS histone family protein [Paraburkholderia fungorum]|uniref:H-NS histone family protein n=1 Tax=Paraburkholderia fungorum TaxID=134537 RepID=A0AAP5UXR8_9BURK|nr:H-NS histone family protein [Paraburkholderia fungorum]AJZ56743.1 H-NS histone family protein [Paraburkholderia fungorum]MDT8842668.1 H-NS histone family protein [Paraburkholderia fungorum]PRZ49233.1 DNA-binding protein H-NS [Paraburkholderia fungorum]
MASYRELLKQREALQRQIEVAQEQEVAAAIEKARAIISEYSLTPEQVFAQPKGKRGPKTGAKAAKYRDPVSGATWSGMGREPLWIKGLPREQFAIQA